MDLTNFNTKPYTLVYKLDKEVDNESHLGLYVECREDEIDDFIKYSNSSIADTLAQKGIDQKFTLVVVAEGDFVIDYMEDNTLALIESPDKKSLEDRENYYIESVRLMRKKSEGK